MSSLQISYSKEIAQELGKIAVFFPGEEVSVGDIIKFPNGKGLFKSKPVGVFSRVTTLENLGINYKEPRESSTPDSYQFSSKDSVNINFGAGTKFDSDIPNFTSSDVRLKVSLSEEGAIFFYAKDCKKSELSDIPELQDQIDDNGKSLIWEETFLVTSVTTAKKALIIQSNSKSSELELGGDIKGLQGSKIIELDINSKIHVKKQKGNLFIKNWSDEVTVFMDVMRFTKKVFKIKNDVFEKNPFIDDNFHGNQIELEPVKVEEIINVEF